MSRLEILDTMYVLGQSQGFYGRLYARINKLAEEEPDTYESFVCELESQNFNDAVDLVMYLEE